MAKSNRRKKQDRSKAEAKRAEQGRRKAAADLDRQRNENLALLLDPETAPREVAQLLLTQAVNSSLGGMVARNRLIFGATAEDLAEVSRLLLEDCPEDRPLSVLAFAMMAAHANGDEDAETRHRAALVARATTLDNADRDRASGADDGYGFNYHWSVAVKEIGLAGHPVEAADLLEPYLAEYPDDGRAMTAFAVAAEKAFEAANGEAAEPGADPARAFLARFADRSGLVATREAVLGFVDRTSWGDLVRDRVAAEVAAMPSEVALNWPAAERDAYTALAREVAFLTLEEGDDDDEAEIAGSLMTEEQRLRLLADFAADPQTPEDLARNASAWAEHARFGVWQLADPVPRPGLWVTDLVCGEPVYAEFPAEILAKAPPWTVWAGCLVPVDGVWRSTGTGLLLSPAEGDAVAQYIERATEMISLLLVGVPSERIPERKPIPFGHAEPYSVRWDYEEPMPQAFADLAAKTTSAVIMEVARDVARHRVSPPQLRNSDGDPMLIIDATISVTGNVTERLLSHPDFALAEDFDDVDGPGEAGPRIEWWGRPVPVTQRAPLLDGMRAHLGDDYVEPEQHERWLRGSLAVSDGTIQLSVNSRKRLDRLIHILAKLGTTPVITAETHVDPVLDLTLGAGAWPGADGAAPAEGWEKAWLDEQIPALQGLTPREAAEGDTTSLMGLESLLRRFEYQNGLAKAAGSNNTADVAWLRAELGLEDAY